MKQTLLEEKAEACERKVKTDIMLCWIAAIATLCMNIAACCLRTDENHAYMLALNVLTDVACGWFVIYRLETGIFVQRRLLRLVKRQPRRYEAVVTEISGETRRIPGMDCVLVRAGERTLYLPQTGTIRLETGIRYTFGLVDNVIVEAESWENG